MARFKEKWKTLLDTLRVTIVVLLVALSFSFNILLVEELFFYGFSPNYNEVMEGMVDYYHGNELPEPVYSKYEDLLYYIGAEHIHGAKGPEALEIMKTEGGTVMWLNLPPPFRGWAPLENAREYKINM